MAVKLKGTPDSIRSLLSGGGRAGSLANGGTSPSRESRNKIKVDQNPSAVPRRTSGGASTAKRAPKPSVLRGAIASEPQAFGQNYSM